MRIAIVKLSALGDIVHAMVGLQFIKDKFPNSKIDWFVESQYKDLLENNNSIFCRQYFAYIFVAND